MATVRQSGGDYGSLNAAVGAAETTITIDQSWTAADTTAVTFSTANCTVTVSGAAKHPGYISGGNYYRAEINNANAFDVNAAGVTIDGVVLKLTSTGNSDEAVDIQGGDNLTLKDCLIYANDTKYGNQDGIYCSNQDRTLTIEQCIIWNFDRGGFHYQNTSGNRTGTVNVNSSTIFQCGRTNTIGGGGVAIRASGASTAITVNAYNTIALESGGFASTADFTATDDAKTTWNLSRCIDSDNSIAARLDSGSNNLASRTETDSDTPGAGDWVVFEDVTTYPYDLRLKDNAENDAQDMHSSGGPTHGLTIPSTDIVGTSRPQNTDYDCGAFEIVAASGGVTVNLTGLSSSGAVGALGIAGGASFGITGNAGAGAVGALGSTGAALQALTGVQSAGAAGDIESIGAASFSLPGVAGTGQPGALGIAGGASFGITGNSGSGAVGALGSTGAALQALTGVQGAGAIGALTIIGGALATLGGVVGTGQVGSVTVSTAGGVSLTLTGVSSTGQPGTLTALGAALQALTGVSATGSAGVPTSTGGAVQSLSGVAGTGQPGDVAAAGAALLTLLGAAATGQVGSVTVTVEGGVSFTLSGVAAAGNAGDLSAIGAALQALTGVSATGAPGDLTVGIGALVALSGVSAAGAAGIVDAVTSAIIQLQGVAATGQVGSITIPLPSDQAGELLATITVTVGISGSPTIRAAIAGNPKLH